MTRLWRIFLGGLAVLAGLVAAAVARGDEALAPPSAERIAALLQAASRDGWSRQEAPLRATARRAYERDQLAAAQAWLNLCRWAALLGHDEGDFTVHWIQRIQSARLAHPNMTARYEIKARPLSAHVSPELQRWVSEHPDFAETFWATLTPVDYVPRVLEILDEIYRAGPADFVRYADLALAIAVVYDVPPPPDWPHRQVPAAALPRRWPEPLAAFRWWTQQAHLGHFYQRLDLLDVDELKFVVDAAAPFDDLEWSQQVANYPLNQLDRAYKMVAYRADRANNQRAVWSDKSYALPLILGAGGICVDQAFFATQVGKARGVPTLLFEGEGNDARHAWFGYLDGNQKWRFDAGRFAEQKFVTGWTRDPQTWRVISDHELKFLAERFRGSKAFRRSRVHADFAADLLETGEPKAALAAAERAVDEERRNQTAWETLLAAMEKAGAGAQERETGLRRAMEAFQLFPDLEVAYSNRLSESLRTRGQTDLAEAEQRRMARRYRGDRNDLTVQQAREILLRAVVSQPVAEQVRVFNGVVDQFGRSAGMAFFDQIVRGFCVHLLEVGNAREAVRAAERARGVMKVDRDSQLDHEFRALFQQVAAAR